METSEFELDRLGENILAISTTRLDHIPFQAQSVEGTGFLIEDRRLVTCYHCVAAAPPPECFYSASRFKNGKGRSSPIGGVQDLGNDLAIATVNFDQSLGVKLASSPPPIGTPVWTFGYPLTQQTPRAGRAPLFLVHPRLLKGHITRPFRYQHPTLGPVPSWELSFPAPEGLSGAPLFLDGTFDIVGVIYGSKDVGTIHEFASIDQETGTRTPEIQRIVSFGLALHLSALEPLRARLEETE